MLKMALLDYAERSIKNVAGMTEDGAFALFFRPENFPIFKSQKNAFVRGSALWGGGGMGAAGIDWCIRKKKKLQSSVGCSLRADDNRWNAD